MAEEDQSSKTEAPTEKKIQEARKKGDVPSSRETGNMMVVVAMIGIVAFGLQWQTPALVGTLTSLIDNAGRIHVGIEQPGVITLGQVMYDFVIDVAVALMPVFGLLIAGALFGVLIKGETVASLDRITPKWSKISLKEGLKRQFSANAVVELVKNLVKVFVVGGLAIWVTNTAVRGIWEAPGFVPETLPGYMTEATRKLLIWSAAFLVPVAIIDILWQRFDWNRKHMMSLKEIKDEMKESEGDPIIRGKRAQLRRQRSQERIAQAVPQASVILTNPTHYAVALKYEQGLDVAPICVAKGVDLMARQIRVLAREHEIPIVENKPLARSLYELVEVDDAIPTEHWEVMAEIISFVMHHKTDPKRRLPDGSTLREDLD